MISKHFKRTEYIVKDWTGQLGENDNPGNHGWIQLKNDEWSFEIQDNPLKDEPLKDSQRWKGTVGIPALDKVYKVRKVKH